MADNTTVNAVVIERTFDASPALVWKAWSEPEHFMQWWGPEGFTSPECKMDFRVGGTYHYCMEMPDGNRIYSTGTYDEIVQHERIAYTDWFADADGNRVSPSHYGMPADTPQPTTITVTFAAKGDQTLMTLTHSGLPAGRDSEMAAMGWNQSFDKLAASL